MQLCTSTKKAIMNANIFTIAKIGRIFYFYNSEDPGQKQQYISEEPMRILFWKIKVKFTPVDTGVPNLIE